jgi:hemerythrin superfamily protein
VDCLEFLKNQHDEAKKLFKRLEKAEGSEAAKIWSELSDKLSMHETLEEKLFYPELKKADSTEEMVLEGYQEHHVMDLLIGEIGKLKPADEAFSPKVKVLQENTEHHIEEEEGELFPKVRKLWNAERRSEVGEKMEAMMGQLPRRQKAA